MKSDYKTIAAYLNKSQYTNHRDAGRAIGHLLGRGDLEEVYQLRAELADGEPSNDPTEETVREVLHGFSQELGHFNRKLDDKLAILVMTVSALAMNLDGELSLSEDTKKLLDRLCRAAVDKNMDDYVKEFVDDRKKLLETIEEYKLRLSVLT